MAEINSQDPANLPVAASELIRDFVTVKGDALTSEIRPEHRGLRRYLASVQGLRWPKSLQPLLLLSEDPITRRFGARAIDLYESFISGDTSGVLEALGHHRDTLPLNKEDLVLLGDVAQGVGTETVARRIGAARVLAGIIDRIPEANRRQLLTPLGRHMVDIKDVRMNVGPGAAAKIVAELASEDQAAIAGTFVDDFLSDKITWQLPSGEEPDLDQLTGLTEQAVDLALSVRSKFGLSLKTDATLKQWLLSREVSSARFQTTLPFERLEGWLEAFPDPLLYDLGPDYAEQAVTHLVNSTGDISQTNGTIGRVKSSLTRLSEGGAESRAALWSQLAILVSAKRQLVAETAYELAGQLKSTASEAAASTFLIAFAQRLSDDLEGPVDSPLDWEACGNAYLDLLNEWPEAVSEDVGQSATPLMHNWAEYPDSAQFAIGASQKLKARAPDAWADYNFGLFNKPLGFFAPDVYAFESNIFEELPETARKQGAEALTQALAADSIADNVSEAYAAFVPNVTGNAWALTELQQHISAAMDRLVSKLDDPSFMAAVLPTVRTALEAAQEGVTSSFLTRLFAASSNSARAFAVAHENMVGYWPHETLPVGAYGANKIASRAFDAIIATPGAPGMESVFASAVDLVSRGIASSVGTKLADAAVALWPNYPSAVAAQSTAIAAHLSHSNIVAILSVPANSPEQTAAKNTLASAVSSDADIAVAVASGLLSVTPVEIDARLDGALGLWLDVLRSPSRQETIRQLLKEELNDEQAARLAGYMFSEPEKVGLNFLLECLPVLLRSEEYPETVEWVTSHFQMLSGLTPTRTERSALASVAIDCLPKLAGEPLAKTAALVGSLGGKGALEKRSELLSSLDTAQLQVVAAQIPSSTLLADLAKRKA